MKKILLLSLCTLAITTAFTQLYENVGIGVRILPDSSRGYKIPLVAETVPNGPAQHAGLLAGDFILQVDERSTRNIAMKDIVAMIVGEEGTPVKLNIERKSISKIYTVVRGKYKYAASFYETADAANSFCSALTKLMNDAGYDFVNSMDTISAPLNNGNYKSKIQVPGVESTGMKSFLGTSCEINVGSFATSAQANTAGTKLVEQLKKCFPDFYYDPEVGKTGEGEVYIGQVFNNGYESAVLQLFLQNDKALQKHTLRLRINGGKQTRYYSISKKAESTAFANSLRTIYKDIAVDFKNVKATRHETKGGPLISGSSWYEIIPVPDGAKSCSLVEGTMSGGAKNCSCGFYQGTNRADAVTTFNNLFEKIKASLGSDFVYSQDYSDWDMNISKNVKAAISFGLKEKHQYESDLPKIVLLYEKYEENSYGVRVLFYKFGF